MTTSLKSLKNSTTSPLGANNIFIGQYENITQYASALITVNVEQNAELKVYTSSDLVFQNIQTYPVSAGSVFTKTITLTEPYFHITLLNTTSTDMNYTIVETIYREVFVAPSASGPASNVNIFDSAGNSLGSVGDSLKVYLSNTSVDVKDISQTSSQVWNNTNVNTSSVSSSLDLVNKNVKNLSVFGTTAVGANFTVVVQFAISTSGTFYDSQYSYSLTNGGDFGFSIACSAPAVRLKILTATAPFNITSFISAC